MKLIPRQCGECRWWKADDCTKYNEPRDEKRAPMFPSCWGNTIIPEGLSMRIKNRNRRKKTHDLRRSKKLPGNEGGSSSDK